MKKNIRLLCCTAALAFGQAACEGPPLSPTEQSNRASPGQTRTLNGSSVVRVDRPGFAEAERIVLHGTRLPSGCDYSFEHSLQSGKVTGGIVEYDTATCDFVVAVGELGAPPTRVAPLYSAFAAESIIVPGARWPTEEEKAKFPRSAVGVSRGEFRVVSPFERAAMAIRPAFPFTTPASAMPNNCPTELDGYKYAYNNTYFYDPIMLRVNEDSVNGEWAYIQRVCVQTAIRQFWVKWFVPTGWSHTFSAWTSTFSIPYPYHWVKFENTATFTNWLFCNPVAATYSEYPLVRIIGHDDGHASFYDDAYSVGDCAFLLGKYWDHYVTLG
ncbi:MAG: hypothetical protein IT359_17665 [Gemmatimonadaceae bacterium]|nr:hypothetical protein [Gemmatimonadaceae bacterium]